MDLHLMTLLSSKENSRFIVLDFTFYINRFYAENNEDIPYTQNEL